MSRVYLSPPEIRPADYAGLEAVLASNWVAPAGPHLGEFESAVASRTGRGHALAVQSGTAALHLALLVLGVGPGDVVVCPTLTFAASANPVRYCGAEPVFVDSEPQTWNLDPELLDAALRECASGGRPAKAVVAVHLYGQCARMGPVTEVCERHGATLIEDAAEALGATYKGRPAGGMGDLSFLSFNGNKIITTSGGGMLLADRGPWIERARYLATQAREPVAHYEHTATGYNYRMSNVLAGLGLAQLEDLERRVAVRKGHFAAYASDLGHLPGVAFMPVWPEGAPNHWLTCLTLDPEAGAPAPDAVIAALEAEDIEARRLWKPLHLQPVFRDCRCHGGGVAESLFATGLCLPSGSGLAPAERDRVVAAVRSCF